MGDLPDGTEGEDICRWSALELGYALRRRAVTARQTVGAILDRIAEKDPELHAFVTVTREQALAEADRLDDMASRGQFAGRLHGIPFSVKDLIPTAGVRTTRGSRLYEDEVPDEDDLVVARLKRAGGILIGKTNTPEFGFGALCANEIAGNTANPYAPEYSSGGSSGGSAVAVATGMAPLSLGTDFGGSVRTPASFCNVVGLRPGAGLVPRVPKASLWETLASPGILARNATDAGLMLEVIAGSDPRDPTTLGQRNLGRRTRGGPPARVGVTVDLGIATVAKSVAEAFRTAVDRMTEAEVSLTRRHPNFTGAQEAFETLRAAMLYHDFGPLLERDVLSPTARWNIERGRGIPANDFLAAEAARARIYKSCLEFFEKHDFLVLPAASVPPFPLDQENVEQIDGRPLRNIIDYLVPTYAISLVGLPAISLPAGFTDAGLPFGLQIVAPPGGEADLIGFAIELEVTAGFVHRFPE